MATTRNPHVVDVTMKAAEDLSAAQYKFVTLLSDGETVELSDAITENPFGVIQNKPNAAVGSEVVVRVAAETKIVAAGALTVNSIVGTSAAGKATGAIATMFPRGRVTKASAADLDYAVIELFNSGVALS